MRRLKRALLYAACIAAVAVGSVVSTGSPAHADDANFLNAKVDPTSVNIYNACGRFWPSSGKFVVSREGTHNRLEWYFTLTQAELNNLGCVKNNYGSPALELDFRLIDFAGNRDWNGYQVSTNLPNAVRDEGWMDSAADAAPGVTNISIPSLRADTSYYATLEWNDSDGVYPDVNGQPRVSFQWVPSHWADITNPNESPACVIGGGLPSWCIFGTARAYVSGGYYTFHYNNDKGDGLPFQPGTQTFVYPVAAAPPPAEPAPAAPPAPAPATTETATSPKLASARNADGRLGLFYIGGDHAIYYQFQNNPGGWWTGGENRLAAYATAISATVSLDGRIELFYIGGDKAVYHRYQVSPAGGWSGEERFAATALSIAATRNGAGRLEVFTVGANHAVYRMQQLAPNSWGNDAVYGNRWEYIPSWAWDVAATTSHDGRAEVFYVGRNNAVYHRWETSVGGAWSGEEYHPANVYKIAAAQNADGRLETFVIGSNMRIYNKWQWQTGANWSDWAVFPQSATQIAVSRNADGRLELFYTSGDGHIWHIWQQQVGSNWYSADSPIVGRIAL